VAAYQVLQQELQRIREGQVHVVPPRTSFGEYAVSLLERKVAEGKIPSAKSRERWACTLEKTLIPWFGQLYVKQIRRVMVLASLRKKEKLIKEKITPRAMRRTFQDLAREAQVKDIVTRAISGHATEQMQRHYSTVNSMEMEQSIGKVISLARAREVLRGEVILDEADKEALEGAGGTESGTETPRKAKSAS